MVVATGLIGGSAYTPFEHDLNLYALLAAGLALFGGLVYSLASKEEVSKKYRPAVLASAIICGVATLAYIALIVTFQAGFHLAGSRYVPGPNRFSDTLRYADWTVTVPLLTAELLVVCSLVGARARTLRASMMAAAFLMITTGFIGNTLNTGARPNTAALLIWGAVSTAFYVYLYVAIGGAVRATLPSVGTATAVSLRNARTLLLSVWGTYPVVYLIFAFTRSSGTWATVANVAFCTADVIAKVGYGALVHKIAKLRTAEDAESGEQSLPDVYPEQVYLSGERISSPVRPA